MTSTYLILTSIFIIVSVALILIILCIGIPLALSDANFDAIPDAPPPTTSERKQK